MHDLKLGRSSKDTGAFDLLSVSFCFIFDSRIQATDDRSYGLQMGPQSSSLLVLPCQPLQLFAFLSMYRWRLFLFTCESASQPITTSSGGVRSRSLPRMYSLYRSAYSSKYVKEGKHAPSSSSPYQGCKSRWALPFRKRTMLFNLR